jgi:hypothetical protein
MIAGVIVTLLLYRGAQQNTGAFPYPHAWAFASWVVAQFVFSMLALQNIETLNDAGVTKA